MVRGALDGVRIVELGQLIAIPFATKLLSDMGAEVIRVESCTRLELYRASGFYDNDTVGRVVEPGGQFLRAESKQAEPDTRPDKA